MTGDRCHCQMKMMGRGADRGCGTEERPCPVSRVPAKIPANLPEIYDKLVSADIDIYSQARKGLSQWSPFDVVEEASGSTVPTTLPRELASFLYRQSDSRKRRKKSHSSADKKSSRVSDKSRASNFWVETEEYFRDLTVRDIDALHEASSFDTLAARKNFFIPVLGNVPWANLDGYGEEFNGGNENKEVLKSQSLNGTSEKEFIVKKDNVNSGIVNGVVKEEVKMEVDEHSVGNCIMEDDGLLGTEKSCSVSDSSSSLEWLLGCRNKICLTSERPSKNRKLLGSNAGLEKVLIGRPSDGNSSLCHFCSSNETDKESNRLIMCSSCQVAVHHKCYGVQEDVDSSWLCSWCKHKTDSSASANPCVLCPKHGGALKPVYKSDQNDGSLDFAHLFCCQWMPEVYIEDLMRMEPIMNVEGIKETRKKLVCNICKVKWGACVRCSHGTCRTSFHPLCAREARQRIEIWGRYGCDDIELRAFCSKHSKVAHGPYHLGDHSIAIGSNSHATKDRPEAFSTNKLSNSKVGCRTLDDIAAHTETPDTHSDKSGVSELQEIRLPCSGTNTTLSSDHDDANDVGSLERSNDDAHAIDNIDFSLLWQKLVDHGSVNLKDVASEIGISPDSLSASLADDNMAPDVQCKVVKWLKTHAYFNSSKRNLKLKIRSTLPSKAELGNIDDLDVVPISEADTTDPFAVKSVPPRRRTRSNVTILNDSKVLSSSEEGFNNNGILLDKDMEDCVANESEKFSEVSVPDAVGEDLAESNDFQHSSSMVLSKTQDSQAEPLDSRIRQSDQSDELASPMQNYLVNADGEPSYPDVPGLREKEPAVDCSFYIHPDIHKKLSQTLEFLKNPKNNCHASWNGAFSCFEILNKATHWCYNQNEPPRCNEVISKSGEDMHQLVKANKMGVLELSPEDEVEGELIYFQHRLLGNAVARKHFTDNLISNVVKSLQQEIDIARSYKWDAVLVNQYLCQLREAKKQGRKERRHNEAQAILAAATAAAAASSRISSFRKDALDEATNQEDTMKLGNSAGRYGSSQLIPRPKEIPQRVSVPKISVEKHSDFTHSAAEFSKEHPRSCDICRRSETILNPILVCSGCKVAVHLDCYRSVKESPGPWYCELCEELSSSRSCGSPAVNFWEKPYFVAECGLCGGTTGALRKSSDGQWVHGFCAEWVLESSFRRGQANLIKGMDAVMIGVDTCYICRRKNGVCIKCNYGHCQATFHPLCARSSSFYMIVKPSGGKLQHKAYCEKHSLEQRAKAETQKHGIEELKSLKQIRVELERLRLLCERIIKREKLKRELVLCSHDILAVKRDHVARSVLVQSSFFLPEVSSESATTSLKGHTDGFHTCSEAFQRSDDATVDSTSSVKHQAKGSLNVNDQRTYDECSTSHHNQFGRKLVDRPKFSGKQIPHRHPAATRSLLDDGGFRSKQRKHAETFEKELVMTSDQASVKNMLLPKGYVYVPADCLPNEKQISQDTSSGEPLDHVG